MGQIVVTGLGRCGTSLMMQILAANEIPCIGEWPSFEVYESASALAEVPPGHAVKILDPHRQPPIPRADRTIVFMRRALPEQAKSQAKALKAMTGLTRSWRAFHRALKAELPRAVAVARSWGDYHEVTFELLLTSPRRALAGLPLDIDPTLAAAVIVDRSPKCLGFMLEGFLLETGP